MKEYLPVNWVDGMKINKSHFISEYNALSFQQSRVVQALLTNDNYGIIPAGNQENPAEITVTLDNQKKVFIRLLNCSAVTRGGFYVHAGYHDSSLQASIPELNVPLSDFGKKVAEFYVVVGINPYERQPAGEINSDEIPPRLPYFTPVYKLHLMPAADVTDSTLGSFLLPVAKIQVRNQQVTKVENYIPPCTVIAGNATLIRIYSVFEAFLGKMELLCLQIVQKILQKKQQNDLSLPIQKICENTGLYISSVYDNFKFRGYNQHPSVLVPVIAGLGRVITNTLDIYLGTAKEEVFNYFKETCGVNQARLEDAVTAVCNASYSHIDCADSIHKAEQFVHIIQELFSSLASLDYIGKRRETGIFVKEQILSNEKQKPWRGNFLAE